MRAPLLTGCPGCDKLTMRWEHRGAHWRGSCPCGESTRASTAEARKLDERAGVDDESLDTLARVFGDPTGGRR